jgi:hypothetical protein
MPPRFHTARFHVDIGPASLFKRVAQVLSQPKLLNVHADHFHDRAFERNAPADALRKFDPATWRLVTVDVRTDTGKFVSTAWEVEVNGENWWVTIGLGDTITTVFRVNNKSGQGSAQLPDSFIYRFVEKVNKNLLQNS